MIYFNGAAECQEGERGIGPSIGNLEIFEGGKREFGSSPSIPDDYWYHPTWARMKFLCHQWCILLDLTVVTLFEVPHVLVTDGDVDHMNPSLVNHHQVWFKGTRGGPLTLLRSPEKDLSSLPLFLARKSRMASCLRILSLLVYMHCPSI